MTNPNARMVACPRGVAVAFLLTLAASAVAAPSVNVRDLGAKGDGQALDTPAIQKAIDTVAQKGGGVVVLPAGTYLSGAVNLRSKVTLRIEKDATLQATSDRTQFPKVASRWEGTTAEYPSPLVVADGCEDVVVEGPGTIAGQERAALFKDCKRVRIDGITFTCRLRWTLHLLYCDGVEVTGCRFDTRGANTDGIDPDSSRNITIRKCWFRTGDDCIAIKSGKNAQGVKVGRPSEDILIEDCHMVGGHAGVSIGSEMSGGVRRVTVRNCVMEGPQRGVRLKTRAGRGGYIEDITVEDCKISRVGPVLHVDMQYIHNAGGDLVPGEAGIPQLRRITMRNITGEQNTVAFTVLGLERSPVTGLTLQNIQIGAASAGKIHHVKGLVRNGVSITGPGTDVEIHNVQEQSATATAPAGR